MKQTVTLWFTITILTFTKHMHLLTINLDELIWQSREISLKFEIDKQTAYHLIFNWIAQMATEEKVRFQLEDYYDILMSANLKEKLKPFVRQFKKKNIPFIYQTIVNTIQVITGKHEIPLMKFNALMATKLFFDTGEYVPIVLIEIYLLPIIFDIALYRIQKRSEEGLTLYFTEKGFDSTKEMKRMGFNYVLLAIQFIFMAAQVKPFRNIENLELKQDSNFAKVSKILQEKGLKPIENYKFYIPSYVNQTRKKYLKRLIKLNAEEYADFFLKLICDQINLNKKAELDIKKLFTFGDAYITLPLINICEEELTNMSNNFVNKKKYLILIGDFIKLGDIYAVLVITRCTFLQSIFDKVQKVKGETGFQAGEGIYPEVEASKADKKEFYIQFLKHIELWANCHPTDQEGEPTDAKKILEILKVQRKFVFPSNILISKIKAEMEENLKLNQKRNEKLIKLIDQHSSEDSRRKMNSSFRDSKLSKNSQGLKVNSYIEFDELEEMVLEAKKKLDLLNDKEKIESTIKALQKFKIFWETNAEKNQIEADQSGDIEIVLEEGDLCAKIVQMVLPAYSLFSKGAISFQQYKDRVDLLMKKEAEDSVMKETSFEQDLPLQPSKKSQSVQKFQDYYQKSSLSQLQSNVKQSELSIKSSFNRIQEAPSKLEQSESKHSISNENSLPQVERKQNQPSLRQKQKEESNISFRQESVISSRQKRKSQKRSIKSESLLEDQFENKSSFAKNQQNMQQPKQPSFRQASFIQSLPSKNIQNSQQIKDNNSRNSINNTSKSIIDRRSRSPAHKIPSKISNQSQSALSSESINYKDAIGRKNPRVNYQDYYVQQKQSFISSQNSISEHFDDKKSSKIDRKTEHIRQEESFQINTEIAQKQKQRNIYTLTSKNQDYYGISQHSNNQKSRLSKISSKLLLENSSLSKNKKGSRILKKTEEPDRQNQASKSIISGCESLKSQNKPSKTKVQQLKIHNTNKIQKILSPTKNAAGYSLLAKYEEDQSIINQPEINPMLHSFHEQKSIENTNPSKISSFRDCFEVNNEIIRSKEGQEKLLKFTKTGKIENFIQTIYPKQTHRNSTIVDIISERNAKRSIQSYRNLRQKSRATETLSQRMKSLQSFNKNMRMKILVRNQENKLQSQKDVQQKNKVDWQKNSRVNGSEPVSFYNDTQSSHQPSQTNLKSQTGDIANNAQYLNISRLINPKIYTHYFPVNKSDKLKKCMLKSKSLLIKNQQFEIGCVTNRRQKSLQISLFITPLKATIQDINLSVMNDHNLKVKLYTEFIDQIVINQQEYINIEFQVQNVPYVIPTLNFKFKSNRNYSHNQLLISIPISFNKFFTFHPIKEDYLMKQSKKISNEDIISLEQFKYSPKLLNSDRIKESLANFELIRKENKVSYYACEAYFKGKIFFLKLLIGEKGTMSLEGKNMTGDHKNTKFLQFLLVTYRQIFEYCKKDKIK